MSAARVAHWLWGTSAAARVARVPLIPLAGAYWAVMKLRAARARADAVRLPLLDPDGDAARRQREGLGLVRQRLGPPGAADRVAGLALELAG